MATENPIAARDERPLSVVHVVRQFHPSVGGLENMVLALTREQLKAGLDARVVTLDRSTRSGSTARWPEQEVIDGVPVIRIPFRGSGRYPIAPDVLRHIGEQDLVHVHGVDFFVDFLAATRLIHRTPMVLSTHGGFFHTRFARRLKQVYFATATRAALTQFKSVIACSGADAELFAPVVGSKLCTIENGVDVDKFADAASRQCRPHLVALGRMATHKRLDLLVEAVLVAAPSVPELRLTIVGNDFDGTHPELASRFADAIASGRVRILTGLDDAAVRDVLKDCSYLASASEHEGFGLGIVEGLSAGLIPLASPIPSHRAILERAGVGHLTGFDDARAAAARLIEILQTGDPHAQQRTRAMAAAGHWHWGQAARRIADVYDAVLGRKRRTILGVPIVPMQVADVVGAVDRAIERRDPLKIAFANAHLLTIASGQAPVSDALQDTLVLNDGLGVDIASRLKYGKPFPANLNGTDFVPELLSRTRHDLRVFLLGGRPDVVSKAASVMAHTWPRHAVVGTCDGYSDGLADMTRVCRSIRDARPDLVLAALGNPKQELWMAQHGRESGAHVLIGVGALFDFLSGQVPRAPAWMRRTRLEWLFRLLREPRRLGPRYIGGGAAFLVRIWRDRHHHS